MDKCNYFKEQREIIEQADKSAYRQISKMEILKAMTPITAPVFPKESFSARWPGNPTITNTVKIQI